MRQKGTVIATKEYSIPKRSAAWEYNEDVGQAGGRETQVEPDDEPVLPQLLAQLRVGGLNVAQAKIVAQLESRIVALGV
jgi:hypothetical protein